MTETTTVPGTPQISRSRRLAYSFLSVLIGWLIVDAALVGGGAVLDGSYRRNGVTEVIFSFFFVFLIGGFLCLVGWTLSLPIILTVSQFERSRFWVFLLVGTAIGPLTMIAAELVLEIYTVLENPNSMLGAPEFGKFLLLPASVSFVTTLIYLLLMRRSTQQPSHLT
jgi:hypothetical protein